MVLVQLRSIFLTVSIVVSSNLTANGAEHSNYNVEKLTRFAADAKTTTSITDYQRVEDFFEFVDLKIPSKLLKIKSPAVWPDKERKIVQKSMARVFELAPGLFSLAGWKRKVRVYLSHDSDSQYHAYMCSGDLVISNKFFAENAEYQLRTIMHEFVHLADQGGAIEYSESWTSLAMPILSRSNFTEQFLNKTERSTYQRQLRQKLSWPNLYASIDLREALAEYCTLAILDDTFRYDPRFDDLLRKLVSPSDSDIRWSYWMRTANESFSNSDHDRVLDCLAHSRLENDVPVKQEYYSGCSLMLKKKLSAAFDEFAKAIEKFSRLGLTCSVTEVREAVYLSSEICCTQKDYLGAKSLLSEILSYNPWDSEALRLRSWCNEKLDLYGLALQDLYRARTANFERPPFSRYLRENNSYALRIINRFVEAGGIPRCYFFRAQLLQQMAESCDEKQRELLLRTALRDLKTLSDAEVIDFDTSVIRGKIANLYVDLNKLEDASNFVTKPLEADSKSKSLESLIATIRILEIQGENLEAKTRYLEAKHKLNQTKLSGPLEHSKPFEVDLKILNDVNDDYSLTETSK